VNGEGGLPRVERCSMSAQAYQILKESIFSERFRPGQKLDLPAIAKQMGVSRTPLKEALTRLAGDGLVAIVPRTGTFVTRLSRRDIEESFDVRRILEVYAIGLAVRACVDTQIAQLRELVSQMWEVVNADDRTKTYKRYTELDRAFHRLVVDCSGNGRLREAWEQINVHVQMARIRYRRADRELDVSIAQHECIVGLFPSGDRSQLQRLMGQHIEDAKHALLRDLDELSPQVATTESFGIL
jgi:DNA-binding GntR family transcriptional regulator